VRLTWRDNVGSNERRNQRARYRVNSRGLGKKAAGEKEWG
jgi:hypothetical protein